MKSDKILLDHGSGGKMAHQLTTEVLLPLFANPILAPLHDGAVFEVEKGRLAFSTDSFVVDPVFFPGGNIGDLAVNGTVNDLAMCGAVPRYMSMGLILEEGFAIGDLERVLVSMRDALERAGVQLVTGDTKVVPRGAADKIYINTTGIGIVPPGVHIGSGGARPGDVIVLSGAMAEHGMAVLTQREGFRFESNVISDTAPLHLLVQAILAVTRQVHVLRDPTRGGVGTALNEIALGSGVGMLIEEERLPVAPAVAGICELLGFDPLYVANEGKLLCLVPEDQAEGVLSAMRRDTCGRNACVIGRVTADHPGRVVMATRIGGRRIVDMLSGEQLPRIC
ncbi:MAG: hydrogenase expression/formation protein HypE [Desulfobacteraceae bacterium]|nr:MAG: hydrogenase expression/formation protein HypE [Desulfobacteraceae bacterium]